MHITVQGLEAAKAKLGALGYIVDNVVDEGIEYAAEPMRQAVEDKAPEGVTRRLKAGIKLRKAGRHEWRIGPDKYYGFFQEFGTKFHRPQSFVRPGYEQERTGTRDRFSEFIRRTVRGVAR